MYVYLKFKYDDMKDSRLNNISLCSLEKEKFLYNKNEILFYICRKWDDSIRDDITSILIKDPFCTTDQDEIAEEAKPYINTGNTVIRSKLFHRTDRRIDNVNLADFLHGRSLRFQNFAHSVLKADKSKYFPHCLECCEER